MATKLLTKSQKRKAEKDKIIRRQERAKKARCKAIVGSMSNDALIDEVVSMNDDNFMPEYQKAYLVKELATRPLEVKIEKDFELLESIAFNRIENININPQLFGAITRRVLQSGDPDTIMQYFFYLNPIQRNEKFKELNIVSTDALKKFGAIIAEKGTIDQNREWIYFNTKISKQNIKRIAESKNVEVIIDVAIEICNEPRLKKEFKALEDIIISLNDPNASVTFSQINGCNFEAHRQIVLNSNNKKANKQFAEYHVENKTISRAQAKQHIKIAQAVDEKTI